MSERKTAAEWMEELLHHPGGLDILRGKVLIADLAACEAEFASFKKDCAITHETDNNEMMAVIAQRENLRRQVKEYADAYTELDEDEADLRGKLEDAAKMSHAYADDCENLREELEDCRRKLEEVKK